MGSPCELLIVLACHVMDIPEKFQASAVYIDDKPLKCQMSAKHQNLEGTKERQHPIATLEMVCDR